MDTNQKPTGDKVIYPILIIMVMLALIFYLSEKKDVSDAEFSARETFAAAEYYEHQGCLADPCCKYIDLGTPPAYIPACHSGD